MGVTGQPILEQINTGAISSVLESQGGKPEPSPAEKARVAAEKLSRLTKSQEHTASLLQKAKLEVQALEEKLLQQSVELQRAKSEFVQAGAVVAIKTEAEEDADMGVNLPEVSQEDRDDM
eukprot:10223191-Alexandrium_andersonii.AAC.1